MKRERDRESEKRWKWRGKIHHGYFIYALYFVWILQLWYCDSEKI